MTEEKCPLHEGIEKNINGLWERIEKLSDKTNDRLFWILLLVGLNLFFSGINVAKWLFSVILKQ